jgi:regulator-associated protein of mTOR
MDVMEENSIGRKMSGVTTSPQTEQNLDNKDTNSNTSEKTVSLTRNPLLYTDIFPSSEKNLYEEERFQIFLPSSEAKQKKLSQWKLKERIRRDDQMKTVSVALVLCLNVGVDPPDVIKTSPCARLECWLDPLSMQPQKAIDAIGKALQMQYERLQPRARYKLCLDPTLEDVKKLCISLRRNAKEERVLFHYNGHGVPKPTNNGEIWVFNKGYTQYIPLSLYELQVWLSTPSIFVFDCSAAGLIVKWFNRFAEQRQQEQEKSPQGQMNPQIIKQMKDYILLAACGANEILPTNPELPADLFTSCLTTPIKIALRWFCSQTIISGLKADMVDKIPGRLNDRRTPLGELNWIFTAITDTIAWNSLPKSLFQKLFRQDLLVASLFRNFLLAERIMRSSKCTPISHPKLPPTYNHPMWQAWDLAADQCLAQLPKLINDPTYEYKNSTFFTEQLTAFEVWLEFGSEEKKPPEQLPIVLQVLLSQQHRLRALELLGKFLDLGPWAVSQALSVGIFPYVLKLLQSPAVELRQVLVFIWAKILALDKSCQLDLVKENGQHYFINVLSNPKISASQRAQAAFILSVICNQCRAGQTACLSARLLQICLSQLTESDPLLRRWVVLALAKLWENYEDAKSVAIKEGAHEKLCLLLQDGCPEVRAAAVYALGVFIGTSESVNQPLSQTPTPTAPATTFTSQPPDLPHGISSHRLSGQQTVPSTNNQQTTSSQKQPKDSNKLRQEQRKTIDIKLALTLPVVINDASPMVRRELIIALWHLMQTYEEDFKLLMRQLHRQEQMRLSLEGKRKEQDKKKKTKSSIPQLSAKEEDSTQALEEQSSIHEFVWTQVVNFITDPHPALSRLAITIANKMKLSAVGEYVVPPLELKKISQDDQGPLSAKKTHKKNLSAAQVLIMKRTTSSPNLSSQTDSSNVPNTTSANTNQNEESLSKSSVISNHSEEKAQIDENDEVRSTFYEWCCSYFSRSLLRSKEEDETAPEYAEQRWRQQRNEHLRKEALSLNEKAMQILGFPKLENEISILENGNGMVTHLTFHPYETVLVTTDDKDGITVWNWQEGVKINSFSNGNQSPSRITSLSLLNEHDIPLIACGSDDGVVRVWDGIYEPVDVHLLTAWKVLSDVTLLHRNVGVGVVVDWQQQNQLMFASGNVGIIRLWDINKELPVQDIVTGSETPVTALLSDRKGGPIVVCGCGDGTVRVFDKRTTSKYSLVQTFADHKGYIINLAMPPILNGQIISGSVSGEVKFWNLLQATPVKSILAHQTSPMTAMSVHEHTLLIAIGSQDQRIKVMNLNGEELNVIRYHDGFLGQRIGPVSCLAFHPLKILLAAGAADSIISIYADETFKHSQP